MNLDVGKPEAAVGIVLALLGGARQEKIHIGPEYAGGYLVQETWASPVTLDEGLSVLLWDLVPLVIVAAGIAVMLRLSLDFIEGIRERAREFREDQQASIAFHFVVFFASLVLGSILWILLDPLASEMLLVAEKQTTTTAAAQGQQYARWTISSLHLIIIGLGILQLLAAVVYQGRVRR